MFSGLTFATARPFLAVVPAIILVTGVFVLVLLALPFGRTCREYALDVMERGIDLAAVLVGKPRTRPPTAQRRLPTQEGPNT
jgi:hypothetical protein